MYVYIDKERGYVIVGLLHLEGEGFEGAESVHQSPPKLLCLKKKEEDEAFAARLLAGLS